MSIFDKLRSEKLLSFTLILFTLSIGIVIGTLINSSVRAAKDSNNAAPGAKPLVIPNPVELSNTFTEIAKMVEPAVVNITTTYQPKPVQGRNRGRRQMSPQQDPDEDQGNGGGMDEFFYRFFGGSPQAQQKSEGVGSGVVVDNAGYILTNNHVVDKADIIKVKFHDDPAEYDAKVVGVDTATDLAVIRVTGKSGLTAAKIGNSDGVQVGEWAIAIGSPFTFQETVTVGIISAKGRDVDPAMQFQHFLQTDAAINPGNSGGPLLNIRGEVVGINTAIVTRSGGYQGIGFALPINTAVSVYNQIIKSGKVTRGGIGVTFTPSETSQARDLLRANHVNEGVFVQSVTPDGPSDKAGIKAEDIIVALNGKPIKSGDELLGIVTATPVGDPIDVAVIRDGKKMNFKVIVGDLARVYPGRFGPAENEQPGQQAETAFSFGMSLQALTEQRRQSLGLKEEGGMEVTEVESNSFAEDIQIQPHDILMAINRKPVASMEDVRRAKATLKPGDAVAFRILRRADNGWTSVYLAGTLPAEQH
ncbi:MAG: Do family serine endopeptidase [Bryobacteraceae bacterium]|jgi:serine protease Do